MPSSLPRVHRRARVVEVTLRSAPPDPPPSREALGLELYELEAIGGLSSEEPRSSEPRPESVALHLEAWRHDWAKGPLRLAWLVKSPACDLGTALMIYWLSAPRFDEPYERARAAPEWRREILRFLRELEPRLLDRDFLSRDILFNPRRDRQIARRRGYDWTAQHVQPVIRRPVPLPLYEPSRFDPEWHLSRARRAAPPA